MRDRSTDDNQAATDTADQFVILMTVLCSSYDDQLLMPALPPGKLKLKETDVMPTEGRERGGDEKKMKTYLVCFVHKKIQLHYLQVDWYSSNMSQTSILFITACTC